MGPVERELRAFLKRGLVSRDEARARWGPLGVYHFDRLLKIGALDGDAAGARLKVFVLDTAERDRRAAHQRQLAERLEAERRAREIQRAADEQQRRLFAGTEHLPLDERRLIVAERLEALRESREGVE